MDNLQIKVLCPACEGSGCEMCDYSSLVDESVANEIQEQLNDQLDNLIDCQQEESYELWIDPAGGIHHGNEKDPAAQYE
jgi:uncharacterized Fe-S cluster-containing MiaB family protein